MAAFTGTPTGTTQYNQQMGVVQGGIAFLEKPRIRVFSYTHAAGAGTGEVNLVLLPEGQVTIYSEFSRFATSAFAVNSDIHIGFRSYTEPDGDVIAADDNAFGDNMDAGGAIAHAVWPLPAAPGLTTLNSRTGITLYSLIDTGNIEDTDTIAGWVFWAGLS